MVQIVMVSHLEGCLLYKKYAGEFSKVFIANGKPDIGRCILSKSKKHLLKNFTGVIDLRACSFAYYSN